MNTSDFNDEKDVFGLVEIYHVSEVYELLHCKDELLRRISSVEVDYQMFEQILEILGKVISEMSNICTYFCLRLSGAIRQSEGDTENKSH